MPNSQRDLKKRLLHIFPASEIKEYYNKTGNATDIIEGLSVSENINSLVAFIYNRYQSTRQNIHIFNLESVFKPNTIGPDFPLTILKETHIGGEHIYCCIPQTTFSVYLNNPVETEDLIFYQPIIIRFKGKELIVHFTKLERNVSTYFPDEREAKKRNVINSQEEILRKILHYLSASYIVETCDFNKGLKSMWDADQIDCTKILNNRSKSVRLETMNGDSTYKTEYPVEYAAIIITSLGNSQWKYLIDDDYLCEAFSADPHAGLISISKFPKHLNQVKNVIDKILANN